MTSSSARRRPRWPLHPLTAVLALLGAGAFAVLAAFGAQRNLATAAAGLLLVAGAAAGFANSGST